MINLIGKRSFWLSAMAFWERSAIEHRKYGDKKWENDACYWARDARRQLLTYLEVIQ